MSLGAARLVITTLLDDPAGFETADVARRFSLQPAQVQVVAYRMAAIEAVKRLFRSKWGHRSVRYFGRPEWAEAHQAKKATRAAAVRVDGFKAPRRTYWPADLPMRITPATKFTFAPPPPARVLHTNTHPIF